MQTSTFQLSTKPRRACILRDAGRAEPRGSSGVFRKAARQSLTTRRGEWITSGTPGLFPILAWPETMEVSTPAMVIFLIIAVSLPILCLVECLILHRRDAELYVDRHDGDCDVPRAALKSFNHGCTRMNTDGRVS